MDFQTLKPYLLHEFKSEHDMLKAIEELSQKFTENRAKISDYLKDPRLVSAYTAFYLTSNIPKFEAVMKWMPEEWIKMIRECILIDLGAGPGTFSLAFRQWMNQPLKNVIQIETSKLMQEQASKIWKGLFPNEPLTQQHVGKNHEGEKFLLFGHSANEMGAKAAIQYIKEINPQHILFIEPGTKDFFPVMLEIRDHLISSGFNIVYPCPGPMLCPIDKSNDWCHQFIHVKQPADIERLSQMVRKDRKLLPLTVQAFSKTFSITDEKIERVIRVLPETKFSFEWEVCTGNEISHYQIMKKNIDKKNLKLIESLLAGSSVLTHLDKRLEKSKRVSLVKLNKLSF